MAASLTQSPRQWLHMSNQKCVTRGMGPGRRMLIQSLGKPIHLALMNPNEQRRLLRVELENCRRTRLAATPNDETEEGSGSESRDVVDEIVNKSEEGKGIVERVEEEMGRQFGGILWFTVLLVCLAVFGGAYVYYIVNFANFDDVPILRGLAS